MARDKKTESKESKPKAVVGPGKSAGKDEVVKAEKKTDTKNGANGKDTKGKADDKKADAKPDAKPDAKADAKPDAKADAKPDAKADAKADDKADDKSGKEKAKAAPGSSVASAPHMVSDDDAQPPSPNLVKIPPETKPGEREKLLRPDQIDTSVSPDTKAPAPGRAPRGDARSLRRATEFCLIYRQNQYLVRRQGVVGTLGNWSIVEYPSPAAAAHAYAQECSELTESGFDDHRP